MRKLKLNHVVILWKLFSSLLIPIIQSTVVFSIYNQEEISRHSKSHEMQKYMNFTLNPCEDFYTYACGNRNKLHQYEQMLTENTTPTTLLQIKIDRLLANLLQGNVTVQDGSNGREMKLFYKSCLEAQVNDYKHQKFLNEFIKSNGGFPAIPGSNWQAQNSNYDWKGIIAQLRYNYGLDILIGLDIDINYQNVHENSIYLTQPSTLLSEDLCRNRNTYTPDVINRKQIMVLMEIEENLKHWFGLTKTEAATAAADILRFEMELCSAMEFDTTDYSSNANNSYDPDTYAEVRKTSSAFSSLYDKRIDFNRIITESYGVIIQKPVIMRSRKYFDAVGRIMRGQYTTNTANYIMYLAVNYINFPYDDGTTNKRPQHCLHLVKRYFPKVLGHMYYRSYAKLSLKAEIEGIFEKIKNVFAQSLENKWLDESIGRLVKKRLQELSLYFPSYEKATFVTYDINVDDFWQNQKSVMAQIRANSLKRIYEIGLPDPSKEVEAYETAILYQPFHKRIDVGWAQLQDPFYHQELPKAILFATTGQLLAEILIQALHNYIFTTKAIGSNKSDEQFINEYYRRVSCFRQQAENYLNNDRTTYNNTRQLKTLIAKSAAIKITFNTYIDWLHYRNSNNDHDTLRKETLPELNFTNTQLFFIAYAQIHCTNITSTTTNSTSMKNELSKQLAKNWKSSINPIANWLPQHTIEDYMVNGPLTNFDEFARDFNCHLGSMMNTADKCNIY